VKRAALRDLKVPGATQTVLERFLREGRSAAGQRMANVVLYGSIARGTSGPDSDIDLLVEWMGDEADGRQLLWPIAFRIWAETGVDISVHVISPERWHRIQALRTAFYENVEREGISVAG